MNWLLKNSEWVFSGIGVFVLGGIITLITWSVRSRNRVQSHEKPTSQDSAEITGGQSNINAKVMDITIRQIVDDINSRPLYQMQGAREQYVGIRIRISGRVINIYAEGRMVTVSVKDDEENFNYVIFSLPAEIHPEFKVMKRGFPISLSGTITKVDDPQISLKDVTIHSLVER